MEHSGKAQHLQTGELGEDLALHYFEQRGFALIERNYRKKWGEIDLILERAEKIHFIEVKAVSYETREALDRAVSHGTYRPEERVHEKKLARLSRAIQTWLLKNGEGRDFQLDVCTVRIVPHETYAIVDVIERVMIE